MKDLLYVKNVLYSIKLIKEYSKNKNVKDFEGSSILRDAVCKRIEEIGENMKKISQKTKKNFPKIEWGAFIETRNFLTHVYQMVNVNKLWNIVDKDLIVLEEQFKKIEENLEKDGKKY